MVQSSTTPSHTPVNINKSSIPLSLLANDWDRPGDCRPMVKLQESDSWTGTTVIPVMGASMVRTVHDALRNHTSNTLVRSVYHPGVYLLVYHTPSRVH